MLSIPVVIGDLEPGQGYGAPFIVCVTSNRHGYNIVDHDTR